jgi:hypothetical protein
MAGGMLASLQSQRAAEDNDGLGGRNPGDPRIWILIFQGSDETVADDRGAEQDQNKKRADCQDKAEFPEPLQEQGATKYQSRKKGWVYKNARGVTEINDIHMTPFNLFGRPLHKRIIQSAIFKAINVSLPFSNLDF